MSFSIEFADETRPYQARIKVIGAGGSGGNAINTMIHFGLEGVEFITVNTDARPQLEFSRRKDRDWSKRDPRPRRRRGSRARSQGCSGRRATSERHRVWRRHGV